jgi:hypothetical protein
MKLYPVAAFAAFLLPAVPALAHSGHCRPVHRAAWHRPVVRHGCACRRRFARHYVHRRPVEVTYYQPRPYVEYAPYPVYYDAPYYGPRFHGGPLFWGRGGFERRGHGGFHGRHR